jgi:hypothetical protein
MFKKLNTKTLLIIFGGLLAIFILVQIIHRSKGESNFKTKFLEIDTAKIKAITIKQHNTKDEFKFIRNGKEWTILIKGTAHKIEEGAVKNILAELIDIKADHIAATDQAGWQEYQTTDSASTHVQIEQEGKAITELLVGKFSYQQNQQYTYARLAGENEVYAVSGFLAMTVNRKPNDFRDKSMVKITNPSDITKLVFSYPDSSFVLSKENNVWMVNGEKVDSAKVADYLGTISSLHGSDFVDESVPSGNQVFSLKIEGKNFLPIELKALSADTVNRYVITSNCNTEGRFSGTKGELAKNIFVGLNSFKTILPKKTK